MIDYIDSNLVVETGKLEAGSVSWRSPSNLAIVKYWGKHGRQLPRNPSISFTLEEAYTTTVLKYAPKKGVDHGIALTFTFDGQPKPDFTEKVKAFLDQVTGIFPFLKQLELNIDSSNSFPHSSGIASSASSMSALALCLCSLEHELFDTLSNDDEFRKKASYVARLGSGSASRSVFAGLALWGKTGEVLDSADTYAISIQDKVHNTFLNYQNAILLIDQSTKSVSSRAGHSLMNGNPYAEPRYQQARQNLHRLLPALQSGDQEVVGNILEQEALALHALMMASNPPYLLMKPNTIAAINRVQTFRQESKHPVYFSLDAGPNLHLLYPENSKSAVESFITSELVPLCQDGRWIKDRVGKGPIQL